MFAKIMKIVTPERNLTCNMKYVPQCRLPDQEHANAGQHLQLSLHIEKSFVC
jgi:hypothetical protein